MKLIHRLSGIFDLAQKEVLAAHSVVVEADNYTFVDLEDEVFQAVRHAIIGSVRHHSEVASFAKPEIEDAEWLVLGAISRLGYPQPEDTWEYDDVYSMETSCKECKVPLGPQTRSFRIRSDRSVRLLSQLEWVHSELFASAEFYETTFRPMGLECRPVLLNRTGKVSERVVQLKLPISNWNFDFSNLPYERCDSCGQMRYLPTPIDFYPPIAGSPPNEIFSGSESFGSGGQTFRHIYVSNRLYRLFVKEKIARWFQFYPLRSKLIKNL